MAGKRIGKRPPKYTLVLNGYPHERVSKCPKCRKQTHARKFALFVHVMEWGPLLLGKTCGHCTPCELVILHRHELEAELATSLGRLAPEAVGNEYLVVGTIDKKVWQAGLGGAGTGMKDALDHLADFREVLELHVEPGGWQYDGEA